MKTKTKKIDQAIVNKIVKKFDGKLLPEKNGNAKRIEFWKVVNYNNENSGEITVLDGCFIYKDGMQGCTGSKFDVISKAEYKERTNKANVIDYIIHSGLLDNSIHTGNDNTKANKIYKELKNNGEIDSFIFDDSYSHLHDYMRAELKLNKTEAYTFSCSGGGRCFDKGFKGNINPELSEVINQFEG